MKTIELPNHAAFTVPDYVELVAEFESKFAPNAEGPRYVIASLIKGSCYCGELVRSQDSDVIQSCADKIVSEFEKLRKRK